MSHPPARFPVKSNCAICGAEFSKRRECHEYCSKPCRLIGRLPVYFERKREKYASDEAYRQKIVDEMRAKRAADPEKFREINRKYREKPDSRVHAAAVSRAWHAENKEKANVRRILRNQAQRHTRPWTKMIVAARGRALDADIPFNLTDEWGEARWTGCCELSGLPFAIIRGMGTKIWAPSIDRIVPSLGYVQTNCRFILFCLNAFKHNGTDADMYKIAEALIGFRGHTVDVPITLLPKQPDFFKNGHRDYLLSGVAQTR